MLFRKCSIVIVLHLKSGFMEVHIIKTLLLFKLNLNLMVYGQHLGAVLNNVAYGH